MNKLVIVYSNQFKKDFKLAIKRNLDIDKLEMVIELLANRASLPESLKDHALTGAFKGYRELHIKPDWLLVYKIFDDQLELFCFRTGQHNEVFRKKPTK